MVAAVTIRVAFRKLTKGATVEAEIVRSIAWMSLPRHPAAACVLERAEAFRRLAREYGEGIVWGQRCRREGFLADRVVAPEGRNDCCGRAGEVWQICSMCAVATCVRCAKTSSSLAFAWRAGVVSPECACMFDAAERDMRCVLRDASCMLETGSCLRPVWFFQSTMN